MESLASEAPEETTMSNALADGIITDRVYWLGVLNGTVVPNRGNIKILIDNAYKKLKGKIDH